MALPVAALPVPVIKTPLGRALMPPVGLPVLLALLLPPAGWRTVGLAAPARAADPERRPTTRGTAKALKELGLTGRLHPVPQTGLDRDSRSWHGLHGSLRGGPG
jgi:hypothetical protein